MDLMGTLQRAVSTASTVVSDSGGMESLLSRPESKRAERGSTEGKSIFRNSLDVMDSLMAGGLGSGVNTIIDKCGCPDAVGDVVGCVVDLLTGNLLGAAGNALDVGQDIARASGNEELEGYLNTGLDAFDFGASIGTKVGMALATGGAGNAALGAAGGGSTAGTAQGIFQGVKMLRGGLEAGDQLKQGNWSGAAVSGFGALANFGPVGELFGVSQETIEKVCKVAKHGSTVANFVDSARSDGRLDGKDLARAPFAQLLGAAGVEVPQRDGLLGAILGMARGSAEGESPSGIFQTFTQAVFELAQGGEGEDASKLEGAATFFSQLIAQGGERGLAQNLLHLLTQAAMGQQAVPMADYHSASVRA